MVEKAWVPGHLAKDDTPLETTKTAFPTNFGYIYKCLSLSRGFKGCIVIYTV